MGQFSNVEKVGVGPEVAAPKFPTDRKQKNVFRFGTAFVEIVAFFGGIGVGVGVSDEHVDEDLGDGSCNLPCCFKFNGLKCFGSNPWP